MEDKKQKESFQRMSWTMCPAEDARRMRETAVHNVGVQKRKQFSVEKTVLWLNALFVVRGTGKFKAHSQRPWLAAF